MIRTLAGANGGGWGSHVRSRGRALAAGLAFAGIGTCAGRAIPERSEQAVATLLGEAIGGEVDPHDFVWEPSRGFWMDAFMGRRVLFLGRRGSAGAPRDLYRATMTLTRNGRPLRVRGAAALTRTDLADESGLVVDGERAAVASLAFDRTQSIDLFDLTAQPPTARGLRAKLAVLEERAMDDGVRAPVAARRISFGHPPTRAEYEFQAGDLVLALDDESKATVDASGNLAVVDGDASGAFLTAALRLVPPSAKVSRWSWIDSLVHRRPQASVPGDPPSPFSGAATAPIAAPATIDFTFPPSSRWAPVEGHSGAFTLSEAVGASTVKLFAFDTRVLSPRLSVGAVVPETRTGHVAEGTLPFDARPSTVAAIAIPSARSGGAWDDGIVIAPLAPRLFTLFESDGMLTAGLGAAIPAPHGTAVQWSNEEGSARIERGLLCVTAAGHLVYAWSASATPDDLRSAVADLQCVATSPAAGGDALGGGWLSVDGTGAPWDPGMTADFADPTRATPNGVLYLLRAPQKASAAAPSGSQWTLATFSQPEPTTIASAYEASIEKMGATVRVRIFMPHRFDWSIRAGEQEKSHRMGGQFEKNLGEADKARAFFAMGLGVGKRHSPLGLRIAGSTGHAFHERVGLLEATGDSLRVAVSGGAEPEGEATELPLTVEARALTSEARIRGPKQPRADLCVLPDGTVVLAEAEFDNHELTASVLAELGCPMGVALDRGADRPSWSEDRSTPSLTESHETTALFALGRPFGGTISAARP